MRICARLFALWTLLTEPHADLKSTHERQQARMLAAIHLPIPASFILLYVTRGFGYTVSGSMLGLMALVLAVALLGSYVLSRTRHYRFGVYCNIAAIGGVVVAAVVVDSSAQALRVMPIYFAHAVIVASLFLSVRTTFLIAGLSFVGLALYGTTLADAQAQAVASDLRYLGTLYILVLIVTIVRAHHVRQISQNAATVLESEARYRNLFEETFEPITIHDNGNVVAMNPAMEEFSGYTNAEIKGRSLMDFVHPESRDLIASGTVAGTGGTEVKLVGKDGRTVTAHVFTKPIHYHGREMRMVSIRDLTNQKLAEAARLENALTQDRQQVLQKLIRHLSHDFRTPLAVIKTSLYMLERSTNDAQRHQKHLDVVLLQTNRLQEMMDDFITLARLDYARRSDMTVELIDIDQAVQSVMSDQQPLATKRRVTLDYRGCNDHQQRSVDKDALQRIAKSLISNALLYTPAGGRVEVSLHVDGLLLLLSVVDNGIGIKPEEVPHIFEPFYRGDPTRSTDTGGAGLGLTIAQRLTSVLGGTINVQSEVGVGSSFRVSLPLSPPELDDAETELFAEPLT